MIKGIIFDLDGTLLNTISDLNNSINETFKLMNVDRINPEDKTMSQVGHGIKNLIIQAFKDTNVDIDLAYNTFLKIYSKKYMENTVPYEGIKELIDELNKLNIKIGVNSNKNDEYTKELIKKHFPSINLDYVLGKREDIKVKPDPEGVNLIINKMNLNKDEVIYCGDSPTDVLTASNAGIKVLSVTWGFRSEDKLKEVNPNNIIYKPTEIINLINND